MEFESPHYGLLVQTLSSDAFFLRLRSRKRLYEGKQMVHSLEPLPSRGLSGRFGNFLHGGNQKSTVKSGK